MVIIRNLPSKKLSGTVEHDETYIKAGSKGTKMDGKDGRPTIPSRRVIPRGPGRGTYEKDTPMVTVAYQRPDETGRDWVVYNVHKGGKKLADIVEETVERGSKVNTDEYRAYKSLKERGYEHETVNHSEGEYVSGAYNEIHTNNCECLVGFYSNGGKRSIEALASRILTCIQSRTSSYVIIVIVMMLEGYLRLYRWHLEHIAARNITTSAMCSLPN